MATAKKTPAKGETKEPKAPKAPKAAAAAAAPVATPAASPPAADPAAAATEPADKGKWTPYEIVDGETKPYVSPTPSAEHAPEPVPCGVVRLEHARALPEIIKGDRGDLVPGGIQSFKDTDRRTMNVVVRDGNLFKQEV
jgi:hypothetical protein